MLNHQAFTSLAGKPQTRSAVSSGSVQALKLAAASRV